jgi:MerR family transcriptional regulator, thiopeptide resistance regulator
MPDSQKIFPVLVYEDITAAHDFLVSAFGFRPVRIDHAPDGSVVHGEVGAGEQTIWLHRVTREHGMTSPRSRSDATGGLAVTVDDVDAHYEHARAAGALIDYPPVDQPYGRREYGARDPEGHRWWFGTPLSAAR